MDAGEPVDNCFGGNKTKKANDESKSRLLAVKMKDDLARGQGF